MTDELHKIVNGEIISLSQDEIDEFNSLIAADIVYKQSAAYINPPILAQLQAIDSQCIRALRTNDTQRLATYEAQAAALRTQLVK